MVFGWAGEAVGSIAGERLWPASWDRVESRRAVRMNGRKAGFRIRRDRAPIHLRALGSSPCTVAAEMFNGGAEPAIAKCRLRCQARAQANAAADVTKLRKA
mmetsp:Transcript_41697/g.117957  ORF Transcript_41697/g.117957 Transcript_41697/m.117957 type:complete len:101 (+) Transcript_41697:35-337(+)